MSEFKGKQAVVLAWYPKAYTSGCTIECKSLAENGDLIRQYDAVYFMASVDPIDKNKGFAAEQKADFPLLSDPTKETAKAYGVLNAMGIASRVTLRHRRRRQDSRDRSQRQSGNGRAGHRRHARQTRHSEEVVALHPDEVVKGLRNFARNRLPQEVQ